MENTWKPLSLQSKRHHKHLRVLQNNQNNISFVVVAGDFGCHRYVIYLFVIFWVQKVKGERHRVNISKFYAISQAPHEMTVELYTADCVGLHVYLQNQTCTYTNSFMIIIMIITSLYNIAINEYWLFYVWIPFKSPNKIIKKNDS